MANNSTPDVFLLLGVEGGSNINKGSGQLIATDLKNIMHDIEETITSHLKIRLDQNALNDLKTQINDTVTEALTSIKGTPVELMFSFNQDSIDKAFRDVKKQLKEQNITISAQPQEKKQKQGAGSTGSVGGTNNDGSPSLGNIKKEAEDTNKAIKDIDITVEKTTQAAEKLQAVLNRVIKLDTKTLGAQESYDTTLDYISSFISTRRSPNAKQNDYIVNLKDFAKYMDKNHVDDYGWNAYKYEGEDRNEKVTEWINKNYALYEQLFEFVENKDNKITGIRIKNQQELSEIIEEQHKRQKELYDQQEAYNEAIDIVSKHLNISATNDGEYELTVSQLQDLAATYPGIIEKLSHSIMYTTDVSGILQEAEATIGSLENEINNTTEAVKELEEVQDKLEIKITTLPSEESSVSIATMSDAYSEFADKMQSLSDAQEINDVAEATEDVANAVEDIADNLDKVEKSTRINEEFEKFLDDATELQQTAEGIEDIGEEAKEATAEVKNLEETLAEISSTRRNLTSSTTSINDTITGISETSVNDETGRSYRTSVNLKRDKEGNLSVTTTDIETNQKAISQLDKINSKLDQYALNLNKVAEADSRDITKETRSGITKTIEQAAQLSALLENIVRSDDPTESLSRLSEEFHFSSFDEGARGLQTLLGDINSEIKNVSQTVTANDKSWVKAADSVDKYKDVVKQAKKETKQLAESDRDNITEEARNEIEELEARASRLADLLGQVSNAKRQSNRTVALNKLEDEFKISTSDKANPTDAFTKGAEKFNDIIADINDKMREANQAVADYERSFNNLAQTQARAASYLKEFNNINSTQYDTKGTEYQNLNARSDLIERLSKNVLAGREAFNAATLDVNGVETYGQAVQRLVEELINGEAELKRFKNTASNIADEAAQAKLQEYYTALKELRDAPGVNETSGNLESIIPNNIENEAEILNYVKQHYDEITIAIRNIKNETEQYKQKSREEINVITQRNKIYQEAENYYKKYQSGIKANITLNQRWQETLKKLHDGGFSDNVSARQALAELQTATKDANAETMSLWGSLQKLFKDHFGSVSATAAIGTLRNVLRGAYENVLEMDKAMTELRKVTNETEAQYEAFQKRAASMAREVGGSIADTINSTADYARLGFSLDEASSLAKAALVYKNVGDGLANIGEASESIISTIKAFSDVDASDAMSIIDKFNEVGNNYAISSQGIGTALQKSAAALASANNSLDESIALITAGNSVVQNPEIIGGVNADVKSSYNG